MERPQKLSMDESFLQKLTDAVFTNLNNEQFGAEDLAKIVGLSRSQIHRKLQKINGKSITQFIREIRLEEAHQLLENEIGTGSEIAYQVGFSSPAYFGKCFHEYFGYTPGNVKTKKKEIQKPGSGGEDTNIIPIHGRDVYLSEEHDQQRNDENRRLAVIMFTDIVGYTSLMGSDEDQAFEVLSKNREIHTKLIAQYKGTLVKEIGDGMLISFTLASEAVHCAIEIQKRAREELESQIRIGIHLGEITFEHEDVYGDGVNLASRIQSITDPGGIYISDALQKSIRGKSDIQSIYLGEFNLKNVDYPIKTYAVQGEGLPVPAIDKNIQFKDKSLGKRIIGSPLVYIVLLFLILAGGWGIRSVFFQEKLTLPSLVVLIPENHIGSDTIEYIISGIHSSLIGDIGKVSELRVISPTTSRTYRDTEKSLTEIASELNADYIIEPSLSCYGSDVCMQLIMSKISPEETQIWEQEYFVEKSQIQNLFRRATKEISKEINVLLTPQEEILMAASRPVDPDAYDAYLMGQFYWEKLDKESMEKAVEYFELAIEKDPDWADPFAGLANAWTMFGTFFRSLPKSETHPIAYKYLNKALELDSNSAHAHYVKALIMVWSEFDCKQGEEAFLKSIESQPNDALCRMYYSHLLGILRRYDEAEIQANLAVEMDPLKPLVLALYPALKDGNLAIQYREKAHSIDPNFGFASRGYNNQMRIAFDNGDYEKWIESWDKKVKNRWNEEGRAAVLKAFHERGHIAAIEEMFKMNEKYGKDCWMSGAIKAVRYLVLNNSEKAMDCLENDYDMREFSLPYRVTDDNIYNHLKDNPRYIALLKKMNISLP